MEQYIGLLDDLRLMCFNGEDNCETMFSCLECIAPNMFGCDDCEGENSKNNMVRQQKTKIDFTN